MSNAENESSPRSETGLIQDQAPASWTEMLAGVALFLVIGIYTIVEEIPVYSIAPERNPVRLALLWAIVLLPPAGVAVGWVRGFPRWSYAYLGALLVSFFMSRGYTPFFTLFGLPLFGRDLPGWRAWIPILLALGIALLVTRSFRPLSILFKQAVRDLSLITYTLFGLMLLLVLFSFDEMDWHYVLPWRIFLALLITLTAWLYLRSRSQRGRVYSLSAGILLSLVTVAVAETFYQPGWVDVEPMISSMISIAAIMLAPAFFSLAQQAAQAGRV